MQEPCNAKLARGRNDDFRAAAIDGMKIAFIRHPHAGKTGKVINLGDAGHVLVHHSGIQHRTFEILHVRKGTARSAEIENAHLPAPRDERGYQVLTDIAVAAGDKNSGHEFGCGSLCSSGRGEDGCSARCGACWITTARSCRKPSAINNLAITNIGPSSRWVGLSRSAG